MHKEGALSRALHFQRHLPNVAVTSTSYVLFEKSLDRGMKGLPTLLNILAVLVRVLFWQFELLCRRQRWAGGISTRSIEEASLALLIGDVALLITVLLALRCLAVWVES